MKSTYLVVDYQGCKSLHEARNPEDAIQLHLFHYGLLFLPVAPFVSLIDDKTTKDVAEYLNEYIAEEPTAYSVSQVKLALWKYLCDEIDELLENIEERFIDDLDKMSVREQDRLLGNPEIKSEIKSGENK